MPSVWTKMPSIWTILSIAFLGYMTLNLWHLYDLYMPKSCKEDGHHKCLKSYLTRKDVRLQLKIYTSTQNIAQNAPNLKELVTFDDLDPKQSFTRNISVDIPLSTRRNGSLYAIMFLMPAGSQSVDTAEWRIMASGPLSKYAIPEASTFNLIGSGSGANESSVTPAGNKPVSHFCSILPLSIMIENFAFDKNNILPDLSHYIRIVNNKEYLPIFIYNEMYSRVKDLVPLNTSSKVMELTVDLQLIGIGKLRLWSAMSSSLEHLTGLGFTQRDLDDVKGLFVGINIYLLLLTMMVSVCHLLFDFLAFKNDISYWRQKDNIVGLSTKAVVWRCLSTSIIFLYLQDQKTSYLVLVPMGIAAVIEYWKTVKALKISITWHGIQYGQLSVFEQTTEEFESEAMRKLYWILGPLCAIGAVYSLLYTPHKGWYSWILQSLVNGVYAFGFIFMLPQLYINYKLKSVAHLPWRAFTYKAFNTFIDDIFAFIITMPTSHRLACFRDDIVFLIYLYQRWLYPVDKQRVNEFGQSFDNNEQEKKTQ